MSNLAVLGRMALTNYILQNVVAVLLFFGYGLGWMGTLPYAMVPVVALLILAGQGLLARAWLARHPPGPLEHVWRTISYGHAVHPRRPL